MFDTKGSNLQEWCVFLLLLHCMGPQQLQMCLCMLNVFKLSFIYGHGYVSVGFKLVYCVFCKKRWQSI